MSRPGYDDLKALAAELKRPVSSLYVLSNHNDPFYAGAPARRLQGEWFAGVWRQFGFGTGTHLRRIHYRLVSTTAIPMLDGTPYRNTNECWGQLVEASKTARYLNLVPSASFVDRRNPEPLIYRVDENDEQAEVCVESGELRPMALQLVESPELELPELWLAPPKIGQGYHVEIWIEKSTANDILLPLDESYGVNIVGSIGEISATHCEALVNRALASGLPTRVLYISDFDPGGGSMPVAAARKIEFFARQHNDCDIQLRPIALTHKQCEDYRLPRIPIKETEARAARFEERFGEGATELDALEALHPGELGRTIEREIRRYIDPTLSGRIWRASGDLEWQLQQITRTVHKPHSEQLAAVELERQRIGAEIGRMRERITEMESALNKRARAVLESIEEELETEAPNADDYEWPEPEAADEDPDPLFDSRRSYVEQCDRFKEFQGKPTAARPNGPRPGTPWSEARRAKARHP